MQSKQGNRRLPIKALVSTYLRRTLGMTNVHLIDDLGASVELDRNTKDLKKVNGKYQMRLPLSRSSLVGTMGEEIAGKLSDKAHFALVIGLLFHEVGHLISGEPVDVQPGKQYINNIVNDANENSVLPLHWRGSTKYINLVNKIAWANRSDTPIRETAAYQDQISTKQMLGILLDAWVTYRPFLRLKVQSGSKKIRGFPKGHPLHNVFEDGKQILRKARQVKSKNPKRIFIARRKMIDEMWDLVKAWYQEYEEQQQQGSGQSSDDADGENQGQGQQQASSDGSSGQSLDDMLDEMIQEITGQDDPSKNGESNGQFNGQNTTSDTSNLPDSADEEDEGDESGTAGDPAKESEDDDSSASEEQSEDASSAEESDEGSDEASEDGSDEESTEESDAESEDGLDEEHPGKSDEDSDDGSDDEADEDSDESDDAGEATSPDPDADPEDDDAEADPECNATESDGDDPDEDTDDSGTDDQDDADNEAEGGDDSDGEDEASEGTPDGSDSPEESSDSSEDTDEEEDWDDDLDGEEDSDRADTDAEDGDGEEDGTFDDDGDLDSDGDDWDDEADDDLDSDDLPDDMDDALSEMDEDGTFDDELDDADDDPAESDDAPIPEKEDSSEVSHVDIKDDEGRSDSSYAPGTNGVQSDDLFRTVEEIVREMEESSEFTADFEDTHRSAAIAARQADERDTRESLARIAETDGDQADQEPQSVLGDMLEHRSAPSRAFYPTPEKLIYENEWPVDEDLVRKMTHEVKRLVTDRQIARHAPAVQGKKFSPSTFYELKTKQSGRKKPRIWQDRLYYGRDDVYTEALLMFDRSNSMDGADLSGAKVRADISRDVMAAFMLAFQRHPKLKASAYSFNSGVTPVSLSDQRMSRHDMLVAIKAYAAPSGWTNLPLAYRTGLEHLRHSRAEKRILFVLTDGDLGIPKNPTPTQYDPRDLLRLARQEGILTIGLAVGDDFNDINEAYQSFEHFFYLPKSTELPERFRKITLEQV